MTSSQATDGYGFAYFAWMRLAPANSYRAQSAERGMTFFMLFNWINGQLP